MGLGLLAEYFGLIIFTFSAYWFRSYGPDPFQTRAVFLLKHLKRTIFKSLVSLLNQINLVKMAIRDRKLKSSVSLHSWRSKAGNSVMGLWCTGRTPDIQNVIDYQCKTWWLGEAKSSIQLVFCSKSSGKNAPTWRHFTSKIGQMVEWWTGE